MRDFDIHDFCNLFSDVHNPVSFSLSTCYLSRNISTGKNHSGVKLWCPDKADQFRSNIDVQAVKSIENYLNEISNSPGNLCSDNKNKVVKDICTVFTVAARDTFGPSHFSPCIEKHNKPWFNRECKSARKQYHLAKSMHNISKTDDNKNKLKEKSKIYKKAMDNAVKTYNTGITRKLMQLRSTNTKDFWNILNSSKRDSKSPVNIKDMFDFFKNINEGSLSPDSDTLHEPQVDGSSNEFLNCEINESEITDAVKKLKNGKAPGYDNIVNEHIASTLNTFLPIYKLFFNAVFDSGLVPEEWLVGIIKPFYKNKGDPTSPENYRPITLLSCLGKLFTSILSKRLELYSEEIELIHNNQAVFRKGFSTLDHIPTLQFLSNTLMKCKKKLFCAFIDFKQAFDTVWRNGLWRKLLNYGINGKCFKYITNMYKGIKSLIKMNGTVSDFFCCNVGVRQGKNLSPFLFSLYINDVENYLVEKNIAGLQSFTTSIENELCIYIKLLVLLYADDTVILAESGDDLQNALNEFECYCKEWKLNVNIDKTQVLIFSKGRMCKRVFYFNDRVLEIVKEFKYLGIIFSRTGSFLKAKKHLCDQAQKAMYGVIRKIRQFNLPVTCQLELFDKMVVPVLLYGCEVWGFEKLDSIERVHLKFLKHILCLKSSTPNYMVYGETGRFPLSVIVFTRMVSYWCKLISRTNSSITNILYRHLLNQTENTTSTNPWIDCIRVM